MEGGRDIDLADINYGQNSGARYSGSSVLKEEAAATAATFSIVIEMRGFWRLNVIPGVQPKALCTSSLNDFKELNFLSTKTS